MLDHVILYEKYRPKTLDECILTKNLKATFQGFVDSGKIPNLVLAGPTGMGKTSIAHVLCDTLGYDKLVINGSLDRNIDTLRNEIQSFASTLSIEGKRKCVIIDEADYLNVTSTQPALRNFMETFSDNCSFILTCNYKMKIMQPIRDSRSILIEFNIMTSEEKKQLFIDWYKNVLKILEAESITYNKDAIV